MKRLYFLFLFIMSFQITSLNAQSSSGTEFWLAYMENLTLQFNDSPVFSIHISSEFDAEGSVGVPSTGFTQAFSVNAGQQIEILLPAAIWYSEASEMVEGKGIKINSDNPIEVAATHYRLFFTEATGVLPTSELSNEYLTTCYVEDQPLHPSSFVIVGTQDNTEIEIIPSVFTLGLHAANVPFTINLNEGEIYQVQALDDLTGSHIIAPNGEAIAVFSGAQQSRVVATCNGFADNHLWEQTLPFDNWTDLYYFVPFKNQGSDVVRILAKDDNTTVYFDCEETAILQTGEYFDSVLSNPTVISSTKPIAMTQLNESNDCNPSAIGDPSMLTHLPTSRQTLRANWRATEGAIGSSSELTAHFTNVITKTANTSSIELDGTNISDEFSIFPGDATLSYAQLTVTEGNHILTSNEPFHTYHYGFGAYDAYTKTGNFQLTEDLEYVCLEIEAEGIFCIDSLINFTANSNFEIASYDWQTSENQSSTIAEPSFTFIDAGDYTVTLTITTSIGQSFTADYDVTIEECLDDPCDPNAVTSIMAEDFCAGSPTQFSYTSTVDFISVEWNFGDSSSNSSENSTTHIYTEGEYEVIFIGTDDLNCEYIEQISIEIIDCNGCGDPDLEINFTGDACIGEEITFTSDFNGIPSDLLFVNWEFGNGFSSDELNPVVVYQFAGDFVINLDIIDLTNDCLYNGVLPITIEDCSLPCTNLPELNIIGDAFQCIGESYLISTETTADLINIQWYLNGEVVVDNNSSYLSEPMNAGMNTIYIEAIGVDNCEYIAYFDFEVGDCNDPCEDYDIGQINLEGEFCIDSIISFSNSIPDLTGDYLWTFDDGEFFTDSDFSISFSEETTINVSLEVISEEGCEDQTDFTFSIEDCVSVDDCLFPPNSVNILESTDLIYCVGDSIQWFFGTEESINITSVFWQVSDGQTFTEFSPEIPILNTNFVEIILEATDENGCVFLDTISGDYYKNCDQLCQIYVPNGFTPNGDMSNETFKPLSDCEPESYQFEIYSRWGELLFKTNNFNESWDGMHRGEAVPSSVYVWVMNYNFEGQLTETIIGDVSVIR